MTRDIREIEAEIASLEIEAEIASLEGDKSSLTDEQLEIAATESFPEKTYPKKKFSKVSAYFFFGWVLIIVGLFLLIRGATTDISVPSPINDFLSSRIVNYDLMFSALSSEITGGFILLVGAIFLSTAAILKCKKDDTSD